MPALTKVKGMQATRLLAGARRWFRSQYLLSQYRAPRPSPPLSVFSANFTQAQKTLPTPTGRGSGKPAPSTAGVIRHCWGLIMKRPKRDMNQRAFEKAIKWAYQAAQVNCVHITSVSSSLIGCKVGEKAEPINGMV